MTDEQIPAEAAGLDTTEGERDPLSTDDGLNAATALMPPVPEDRDVDHESGNPDPDFEPAASAGDPELEVDDDGNDPLADLAAEED